MRTMIPTSLPKCPRRRAAAGAPRLRPRFPQVGRVALAAVALIAPLLAAACSEDELATPAQAAEGDLYWDLRFDHHAVVLSMTAPYDTFRVTARPRNFRREPLAGLPTPVYTSQSTDNVIVTTDGLLIARAPTNEPVAVASTLTTNNIRHTDTLRVLVVDNPEPPALTTFSVDPLPPDSAKLTAAAPSSGLTPSVPLRARATDANGDPIPVYDGASGILPLYFESEDTSVATIHPWFGSIVGKRPGGSVGLVASTVAFGVAKADTVTYRIGWPLVMIANVLKRDSVYGTSDTSSYFLSHPDIAIGTGGAVTWHFITASALTSPDTALIEFAEADRPNVHGGLEFLSTSGAAVFGGLLAVNLCGPFSPCPSDGGNMLLVGTPFSGYGVRYFPVAGTYNYTIRPNGTKNKPIAGRVVVVDETAGP